MRGRTRRERLNLTNRVVKRRCRIARRVGIPLSKSKDGGVPIGRLRKWNFTCACWCCHHRRQGRYYKAKGATKREGVIYV